MVQQRPVVVAPVIDPSTPLPQNGKTSVHEPESNFSQASTSITPERRKRRRLSEIKSRYDPLGKETKEPTSTSQETCDRLLPCGVCGREFMAYPPNGGTLRIWKLREHVTLHFDGAVWKCPLCDFDSKNKQNIYLHLTKSRKHGERGIGEKPELAVSWEDYVKQFKEVAPKCFPEQADLMNVQ